jgi:hypothetical protein
MHVKIQLSLIIEFFRVSHMSHNEYISSNGALFLTEILAGSIFAYFLTEQFT